MGDYLGARLVVAAVLIVAVIVVVDVVRSWSRRRAGPRDVGDVIPRACPGPLIWYEVPPASPGGEAHGLLECAARGCTYLIATPQLHDPAHRDTPLMKVPT